LSYRDKAKAYRASSDPHDPELHRTCPKTLNRAEAKAEIEKLMVLRR